MLKIGISSVAILSIAVLSLPRFLRQLGLHPHYERRQFDLKGKKALIITTSQSILGSSGKATGVYASEMTIPYYEFLSSGMDIDIASIKGGAIPIESASLRYPLATPQDKRFLKDLLFQKKVQDSLCIEAVDFTGYDIILMAGGWGAAYDLGTSDVLGKKITEANEKGILIGSICHGGLGLIKAKSKDGRPLVEGRKVTAVTNRQIRELKISITPMHPETELRKLGADFQSATAFKDFLATLTVVDGNLVTGQNQNAGTETAQKLMLLLDSKKGTSTV